MRMGAEGLSLVGEVCIPPERRDELNERVLSMLWRLGMRRRVKVEVAGTTYDLVRRAEPDADGIVFFDWSVFDGWGPGEGTYDVLTCELRATHDRTNTVYGVTIGAITTLLQAYSTTPCLVAREGKLCYTGGYRGLVDDILGEEVAWPLGPGVFDGLCVARENPELHEVTPIKLYYAIPVKDCDWLTDELLTAMVIGGAARLDPKEEVVAALADGERLSRWDGIVAMATLMGRESDDGSFEGWMRQLLSGDVECRRRLAEDPDATRSALARLSIAYPAPIVLQCFASARHQAIFDTFDGLGVTLYRDYVPPIERDEPTRCQGIPLSKLYGTRFLDEAWALGMTVEGAPSEEMEGCIAAWHRSYDECVIPEGISMENLLARVLRFLLKAWECRPIDAAFVDVMRAHADDERYLRLITVLVDMAVDEAVAEPELTAWQAIRWVLSREKGETVRRHLSTFVSIVADADLLRQVFGIGQ